MNLRDVYTSQAIAVVHNEAVSNAIPFLGESFFPRAKKMGLDLKWIKTSSGLPVSLKPSAFDTKSTIRQRKGFATLESEMAYFKESMLVTEQDEQEILRVEDANDPYARDVLRRVFDDANTLVKGADVVPERMRMQLLAPSNGSPSISIQADNATYSYNYDPDGYFAAHNFATIATASSWDKTTASDPLVDIQAAKDALINESGETPRYILMSQRTMRYLIQNNKMKGYVLAQNATANVLMSESKVREVLETNLGITPVVYNKKFINDAGQEQAFYPDGMATLVPEGTLGNTWYGTTPDERTHLNSDSDVDVSIVGTGVAVAVRSTHDPDHTKTTVSEIVLPSFERMNQIYVIKAY